MTGYRSEAPGSICLPDGTEIDIENPREPIANRNTALLPDPTKTQLALVISDWIEEPGDVADNLVRAYEDLPAWQNVRDLTQEKLEELRAKPEACAVLAECFSTPYIVAFVSLKLSDCGLPAPKSLVDWTICQACYGVLPSDSRGVRKDAKPLRATEATLFLELFPPIYKDGIFDHQSGRVLMTVNYYGGTVRLLQQAHKRYVEFANWVTNVLGVDLLSDLDLVAQNKGAPRKQDPLNARIDAYLASGNTDAEFIEKEDTIFKKEFRAECGTAPTPEHIAANRKLIRKRLTRRRNTLH